MPLVYIERYMDRQGKMACSATGKINPALGFANHGADLAYRARFTINFCSRVRILLLGPEGRPLPSPVVHTPGSVQGRPFVTRGECSYTSDPAVTDTVQRRCRWNDRARADGTPPAVPRSRSFYFNFLMLHANSSPRPEGPSPPLPRRSHSGLGTGPSLRYTR
jgi:hypothetical protein